MTREELREKVAEEISRWVSDDMPDCRKAADAAIALCMEEAARVAETCRHGTEAAAIRALKEKKDDV